MKNIRSSRTFIHKSNTAPGPVPPAAAVARWEQNIYSKSDVSDHKNGVKWSPAFDHGLFLFTDGRFPVAAGNGPFKSKSYWQALGRFRLYIFQNDILELTTVKATAAGTQVGIVGPKAGESRRVTETWSGFLESRFFPLIRGVARAHALRNWVRGANRKWLWGVNQSHMAQPGSVWYPEFKRFSPPFFYVIKEFFLASSEGSIPLCWCSK